LEHGAARCGMGEGTIFFFFAYYFLNFFSKDLNKSSMVPNFNVDRVDTIENNKIMHYLKTWS
jgi:hypothetical protein